MKPNTPDHYNVYNVSCTEIFNELENPLTANAFKYVYRSGHKDDRIKDLDKAIDCLNDLKSRKSMSGITETKCEEFIEKISSYKYKSKEKIAMSRKKKVALASILYAECFLPDGYVMQIDVAIEAVEGLKRAKE